MYSIITFKKGQASPSTEVCGELGRCRRGLACKECRISRVKCSGKLDGKDCERCKRLGKFCYYTKSQSRNHHHERGERGFRSHRKRPASTTAGSSKGVNGDNDLSDPLSLSPTDATSSEESQFTLDDIPDFDFGAWLQLQNTSPSTEEPTGLHIGSAADVGTTELPNSLQLPFLQSEGLDEDQRGKDQPLRVSGSEEGTNDKSLVAGGETSAIKPVPDLRNWRADAPNSICQCECLQAMTSSLSILRGYTWCDDRGRDHGIKATGAALISVKVEEFLTLFERSMARLQIVEDCPLVCVLTQELVILVLLVVEQLAKLLAKLAEDLVQETSANSSAISKNLTPNPSVAQTDTHGRARKGQDIPFARIGIFEITDPLDLQMMMKQLLQIRARALDGYICRWATKANNYGLEELEADLSKIRGDLKKAVIIGN